MDQGADGLVAKPGGDQAADSFDEGRQVGVVRRRLEEGEDRRGGLHEGIRDADDRYAKMLSMLVAQAKKAKAGS